MNEFFIDSNIESKIQTQAKFQVKHDLWVEKYRPINLDTFIGNDLIKEKSAQFISSNDIPHLLFFGRAGGGKCLDFNESIDIEIELTDDEYNLLKKYEIK